MTSRERVLKALSFQETDRAPLDLAAMASTSVSCFAYPGLVAALGLPPRRPRVYDTGQMLALPDVDVLDALGCDVVASYGDFANAFEQPELWKPFDFGGRLPALVRDPDRFKVEDDGTVTQPEWSARMLPASYVFNSDHAGQPVDFSSDIPKPDLEQIRKENAWRYTDEQLKAMRAFSIRVRETTDRAVMFNGPGAGIGVAGWGGIGLFPVLCLIEPDLVAEYHEIVISNSIERIQQVLEAVGPYVDVYQCSSDDWGTQSQTIASPDTYATLFQPYYKRFTDAIHAAAPNVRAFLHSCGAIYDILDLIIDSGFDAVNPVQWTAGGHSYQEWKDKCRNRITLWGGGVNTQVTLPLGSVEEVEHEAAEIARYMKQDGGYVFSAIHNILAEIPGDKIVAMYRAARNA